MPWCIRYALLFFVVAEHGSAMGWDHPSIESLKPGLDQITPGRVTGTISFLASDELGGRATGTNEFNIAASYVASRLRGAGCEGGVDGSFYHETPMRMTQLPTAAIVLENAEGQKLSHFGLLGAASDSMEYEGPILPIDLSSKLPEGGLIGVVSGTLPAETRGPRGPVLSRIANSLKAAGAQALLLEVDSESEWIARGREGASRAQLETPRTQFEIPVLMVPKESLQSSACKLALPSVIATEMPMRNVIGVLKGTDPELSKEAIVFSAHLDHLGSRPSAGDGIYNGADDDASGVTAVVTLADAFAAMPRPKRSVLFMTFWGEEMGLLGSKQFVANPSWPLDKLVSNINIEMIGRPEAGARGKIWMTGWGASNLGTLMNHASQQFGVEIFEHPKLSAPLYRQSDNWSFVERGVIAHSFSAGSLHADYHQPDDEWDRLEIDHMTRVIQGLFVGAMPLVDGETTPTKAVEK